MTTPRSGKRFIAWAAVAGVVAGAVFLAVAELAALVFARTASPILAVGAFVIDIVPRPLKEFAITTFGEYDKIALLVGLGLAVLIASAIAGILQYVRPHLGAIAIGLAGVLSGAAIVTRAEATVLAYLPPILGTIGGVVILVILGRRLRAWREASTAAPVPENPAHSRHLDRRRFQPDW